MSIVAADIKLKLSVVSGSAGNTTAGTVGASLGKYISTTVITDGAANGLFPSITGAQNAASRVDYACVFVHNSHATLTLTGGKLYIANTALGATVDIWVDSTAISAVGSASAQALTIASDITAPAGASWSSPTVGSPATLGDLTAGQVKAFWVRRTAANTAALANDGATFTVFGDTL